MKSLKQMSAAELYQRIKDLEIEKSQDLQMDGSGDCGDLIEKAYAPIFDAIYDEINRRDLQSPEDPDINKNQHLNFFGCHVENFPY